tara:strand:+ start:592 stop:816 length:225 start_codon:yes stop_codon:yes gene_type:complete
MIKLYKAGTRIVLISMGEDPNPIPSGSLGTVVKDKMVMGDRICSVNWDCKRGLNLISPPDIFISIDKVLSEEVK